MNYDAYNRLAKEIVVRACEDYIMYSRLCYRFERYNLKRKPTQRMQLKQYRAIRELKELETFFYSDWCYELSGLDGETIIKHLKARI